MLLHASVRARGAHHEVAWPAGPRQGRAAGARLKVAEVLADGPDAPLARHIACLKLPDEELTRGINFFLRLKKDVRRTPTPEQQVFYDFAIDTLAVVGTAAPVERINGTCTAWGGRRWATTLGRRSGTLRSCGKATRLKSST